MKTCTKCGEIKNNTDFYKNLSECKKCSNLRSREYYKNNKEKILTVQAARYSQHKELFKEKSRDYYDKNKSEINRKQKENRKKNPERYRIFKLKSTYGITKEEYENMFFRQNGVCAICRKPSKKTLFVDHNHETGQIRDLLCPNCNFAIGYAKENVDILKRMINYIQKWSNP